MNTIASFGEWVRRRRKALDLTQEALSILVCCAVITIKKIEQDERRPSRQMAGRLADCLAVPDEDRPTFIQAALGERPTYRLPLTTGPASPTASKVILKLPNSTTPFIGRQKELAEASLLIRRHTRLLTLTGPGGVGKSRLALELAHKLCPYFPDGIFFVRLSSDQDPELVISKIAETMEIKESGDQSLKELVLEQLRQRTILLLLDNFDHLLQAANLVAEFLNFVPELRVLATCRSPLHLSNEHLFPLQPLGVPEISPNLPWAQVAPKVARTDSVRLFMTCARARSPEFSLSARTGPLVAKICQQLDGMPLAIKLAAAQINNLSLARLQSSIEHRLDIFKEGFRDFPPHHQTLHATFDWSYEHLIPIEQRLFQRLGVFSGGFTLEAAIAVCGIDEIRPILDRFIDKNFVYRLDESRFSLFETIREYSMERLEIAGEMEATRCAHLDYYTKLVEAAGPHLWNQEQEAWRKRLSADLDNIRAALRWSLERQDSKPDEIELGARMAGASGNFWFLSGRATEGRRWLEMALQKVDQASAVRAKLWLAIGSLFWQGGELTSATESLRKSVDIYRWLENKPGLAEATHKLAHLIFAQQYYGEAEDIFRESLALYDSLGNRVLARTIISELGMVACFQGDLRSARKYYEKSLTLQSEGDKHQGVAERLAGLASSPVMLGECERAARFFVAAEGILNRTGLPMTPVDLIEWQRDEAKVRASCDPPCFKKDREVGEALCLQHAIELANQSIGDWEGLSLAGECWD